MGKIIYEPKLSNRDRESQGNRIQRNEPEYVQKYETEYQQEEYQQEEYQQEEYQQEEYQQEYQEEYIQEEQIEYVQEINTQAEYEEQEEIEQQEFFKQSRAQKAKGQKFIDAQELYAKLLRDSNSLKPVGDLETEHIVYIEDYAHTYLYQYAATSPHHELSAVLIGQRYEENKETIIVGMIPIAQKYLSADDLWLSEEGLKMVNREKEKYFQGASIVGWLHMQPGYGTMVSSKEIKIHREFFRDKYSLLLLVDSVNRVETFFAYDDETLKEQTGYYLFYDQNPAMQEYMMDNPLLTEEDQIEEVPDKAVYQFRDSEAKRKKSHESKQKSNFSLVAGCLALLALGVVFAKYTNEEAPLSQSVFNQEVESSIDNSEIQYKIEENLNIADNQTPIIPVSAEKEIVAETTNKTSNIDDLINRSTPANQNNVALNIPEKNNDNEQIPTTIADEVDKPETVTAESDDVQSTDEFEIYTVEPGDTVRKISQKYFGHEGRVHDILGWSGLEIEDGDNIWVGQKLKIFVD
ncbi:MAG: hypothetical protein ATN31_06565 [Candidatus Epulonipiscioides saccharophilum]|nr:MAG: hypothetical protein ATN31_06565 [Epulopiscium sp. AS2M-Bin001]